MIQSEWTLGLVHNFLEKDILSLPLTSTSEDAGLTLLSVILFTLSLRMELICRLAKPRDQGLDSVDTELLNKLHLKLKSLVLHIYKPLLGLSHVELGFLVSLSQIALVLLTQMYWPRITTPKDGAFFSLTTSYKIDFQRVYVKHFHSVGEPILQGLVYSFKFFWWAESIWFSFIFSEVKYFSCW